MRTITALFAVLLALSIASPATADATNYYGKDARSVARDLGCAASYKSDPGKDYFSGGGCKVNGIRAGMATFRGAAQQAQYKAELIGLVKALYPPGDYYFAADKGVVVVYKSFSQKLALIARRRLGATVVRIHVN